MKFFTGTQSRQTARRDLARSPRTISRQETKADTMSRRAFAHSVARNVDRVIDEAVSSETIVGTVVTIARNGETIYRRAAGYADRENAVPAQVDTLFRYASLTKLPVSAAALAIIEEGALGLGDLVTKWIPDFRARLADGRIPQITIKHLLNHMSGLIFNGTWQRSRVHFMRNALAYAGKGQRQMVLTLINTVFAHDTAEAAHAQWRTVADQLREKFPKLSAMMDDSENDVLALMDFPKAHRKQLASSNPLERLNAEIKRRTNVVGVFPNDDAIVRLVGALLLEQNDEWQLQSRYMQLEGLSFASDNQPARLSAVING